MKQKVIHPKIKAAIIFFVVLILLLIPLTLVMRARIEAGMQ